MKLFLAAILAVSVLCADDKAVPPNPPKPLSKDDKAELAQIWLKREQVNNSKIAAMEAIEKGKQDLEAANRAWIAANEVLSAKVRELGLKLNCKDCQVDGDFKWIPPKQ